MVPTTPKAQRWHAVPLIAGVLAIAIVVSLAMWLRLPKAAGPELELEAGHAYGWVATKDVGEIFTDGLIHVAVSPDAKGPLRLKSATPIMEGDETLRVLGVLARVLPDMRPPNARDGWFQESAGFPPTNRDHDGGVPVNGLVVPVRPAGGSTVLLEIQIGYEVVAEGRHVRRGVELVYEYQGQTRKALIPSFLTICAPAGVECEEGP